MIEGYPVAAFPVNFKARDRYTKEVKNGVSRMPQGTGALEEDFPKADTGGCDACK